VELAPGRGVTRYGWTVKSFTFPNLPGEAEVLQSLAVVGDFDGTHTKPGFACVRELEREGFRCSRSGCAPRWWRFIFANHVTSTVGREGLPESVGVMRSHGWTLVDEA
jgi:hypothetical protein